MPATPVTNGLCDEVWNLMKICWETEPEQRPSLVYILAVLDMLPGKRQNTRLCAWEHHHIPSSGGFGISGTLASLSCISIFLNIVAGNYDPELRSALAPDGLCLAIARPHRDASILRLLPEHVDTKRLYAVPVTHDRYDIPLSGLIFSHDSSLLGILFNVDECSIVRVWEVKSSTAISPPVEFPPNLKIVSFAIVSRTACLLALLHNPDEQAWQICVYFLPSGQLEAERGLPAVRSGYSRIVILADGQRAIALGTDALAEIDLKLLPLIALSALDYLPPRLRDIGPDSASLGERGGLCFLVHNEFQTAICLRREDGTFATTRLDHFLRDGSCAFSPSGDRIYVQAPQTMTGVATIVYDTADGWSVGSLGQRRRLLPWDRDHSRFLFMVPSGSPDLLVGTLRGTGYLCVWSLQTREVICEVEQDLEREELNARALTYGITYEMDAFLRGRNLLHEGLPTFIDTFEHDALSRSFNRRRAN